MIFLLFLVSVFRGYEHTREVIAPPAQQEMLVG